MKKKHRPAPVARPRSRWLFSVALIMGTLAVGLGILFSMTEYESYSSLYDADYVGSETCGDCHTIIYQQWQGSPHANMTHPANAETVKGDFADTEWTVPGDRLPAARMYQTSDGFYMALRHPGTGEYVPFKIEYAIGYQYRQTYLTREAGGVLRRLPLEWSVPNREFFPYWNFQENSLPSVEDFWAQMDVPNSAWNLFCARCHTTHLTIVEKNPEHTFAVAEWVDDGIACEACHGPGSQHVNYFDGNYVNRVAAFLNSQARGQPVAYIANPPKLTKGQAMSVCARCHGTDILMSTTEVYRAYEPGYSQEGRINDLSAHFLEAPLPAGRLDATVETWQDGRPKGIGMLFRSLIESQCYALAEVRCYDCHQPHSNKEPTQPGLLEASAASNAYCLKCHTTLATQVAEHSQHVEGTPGSFCYDCHMPRTILNLATGSQRFIRGHTLSSIPNPALTEVYGVAGSPNACNDCHQTETAAWATQWVTTWWQN